jgi:hypothetical protein
LWDAAGANAAFRAVGMRQSDGDKRRAIELALKARPKASNRQIAKQVGASHTYVGQIREALEAEQASSGNQLPDSGAQTRTVERGDTSYEMDVSRIGGGPKEDSPPSPPEEIGGEGAVSPEQPTTSLLNADGWEPAPSHAKHTTPLDSSEFDDALTTFHNATFVLRKCRENIGIDEFERRVDELSRNKQVIIRAMVTIAEEEAE